MARRLLIYYDKYKGSPYRNNGHPFEVVEWFVVIQSFTK
jgi:hypothetical protein